MLPGVRVAQSFSGMCPRESVFDYMTDPGNLRSWQTSKTRVEPITEGPPRAGYRVREWTKVPGRKEFEQVVEFTEFERPGRLHTHIVEGPQPIDGTWVLTDSGGATEVSFVAEGPLQGLLGLLEPIVTRMIDRQFTAYHENLRRSLESRAWAAGWPSGRSVDPVRASGGGGDRITPRRRARALPELGGAHGAQMARQRVRGNWSRGQLDDERCRSGEGVI